MSTHFRKLMRKLHDWELLHLREHAAELEAENERLRRDLDAANDCADMWNRDVMRLIDDGVQLGITQAGQIVHAAPRLAS